MKRGLAAAVALALLSPQALAHRLDEYLQGALVSVEKNRVEVQLTLTPGVAVYPLLASNMDADRDGAISAAEQHAYAGRVLRDLSLKIDGRALAAHLVSADFPALEELKEGRGGIRMVFDAALPGGGVRRKFVLENRHLGAISAYQVNCLVPRDPNIRISAQNRNYSQSFYELEFTQAGSWPQGAGESMGIAGLFLAGCVVLFWRRRTCVTG